MSRRQVSPARLTWHVGSVLPHASLWHTLRRVAALNSLRDLELFNRPVMRADDVGPSRMRPIRALFNEHAHGTRSALALGNVASWLGEAPQLFRWSHLGELPASLRCLVSPAIRLCPACVAAGYHSALFSLVLLRRCPIHGCELVSTCPTGHPLSDRIDGAVLQQPALCDCGRAAFFTRQTCRRPTMTADDTRALQPVVDWLNRIASFTRPCVRDACRPNPDAHFLSRTAAWCEVLEVPYPACFERQPRLSSRVRLSRTPCATGPGVTDDELAAAVAGLTAAFARHLRRHVAPRSIRAGQALMQDGDPLRMAATMRADPRAMVAFSMLVFTGAAEPSEPARRWPHRLNHAQATRLGRQADVYGKFVFRSTTHSNAWLAMHAAEVKVVQRWRCAQLSAQAALRSGIADWRQVDEPAHWVAQSGSDGQRFASMFEVDRADWRWPCLEKSQRMRRTLDAQRQRQTGAAGACSGPALVWHPLDGWKVEDGAQVGPERVDRLRLLGVVGSPWIWLYQRGEHFEARGRDFPVLARGASPRAAIEALRAPAARYLASFPPTARAVKLPLAASSRPIPVHRDVAPGYLARYGFWRPARLLREAAEVYLSRRQDAFEMGVAVPPEGAEALDYN